MFDLLTLCHVDLTHFVNTFISNDWDLGNLLKNATKSVKGWASLFATLLGTITFAVGAWFLFRIVFGKQQRGQYALQAILALVIGGLLVYGGITGLQDMAQGGHKTIEKLGQN